ncbi:MAG TPA: hypothetical protein ENH82_18995 [bacterium]|nr:hypothetical protein [bacterium]
MRILALLLLMSGCSMTWYSTPDKGLLHLRFGDIKQANTKIVIDGDTAQVGNIESKGVPLELLWKIVRM